MPKKLTIQEFITRAKEAHGETYDYSKVVYINTHSKVLIKCKEHGYFEQTPSDHMRGHGCPKCRDVLTSKRQTKPKDLFISQSTLIHKKRYDYSKVVYVNRRTKVEIVCPIHGSFWQVPFSHVNGNGCPKCVIDKNRKIKYGVAITDIVVSKSTPLYRKWRGMFERCYDSKVISKEPSYSGCEVCGEWHILSNFARWFNENYVQGYHLDKDIIIKGNKLYSPETCCFIPQEINCLLTNRKRCRGNCPIGVRLKGNKYEARLNADIYLGMFDSESDAFYAYKKAKEQHIKQIAEKYFKEGKITERVYNALMKYEVEITD